MVLPHFWATATRAIFILTSSSATSLRSESSQRCSTPVVAGEIYRMLLYKFEYFEPLFYLTTDHFITYLLLSTALENQALSISNQLISHNPYPHTHTPTGISPNRRSNMSTVLYPSTLSNAYCNNQAKIHPCVGAEHQASTSPDSSNITNSSPDPLPTKRRRGRPRGSRNKTEQQKKDEQEEKARNPKSRGRKVGSKNVQPKMAELAPAEAEYRRSKRKAYNKGSSLYHTDRRNAKQMKNASSGDSSGNSSVHNQHSPQQPLLEKAPGSNSPFTPANNGTSPINKPGTKSALLLRGGKGDDLTGEEPGDEDLGFYVSLKLALQKANGSVSHEEISQTTSDSSQGSQSPPDMYQPPIQHNYAGVHNPNSGKDTLNAIRSQTYGPALRQPTPSQPAPFTGWAYDQNNGGYPSLTRPLETLDPALFQEFSSPHPPRASVGWTNDLGNGQSTTYATSLHQLESLLSPQQQQDSGSHDDIDWDAMINFDPNLPPEPQLEAESHEIWPPIRTYGDFGVAWQYFDDTDISSGQMNGMLPQQV